MFRAFTLVKNYSLFLKENKRALTNFFVNSGNNYGHSYSRSVQYLFYNHFSFEVIHRSVDHYESANFLQGNVLSNFFSRKMNPAKTNCNEKSDEIQ